MNTKPDEQTLALWLDDELTGDSFAEVESWAQGQASQLTDREKIRNYRATLAGVISADQEPPYPDFFNHKISQAIQEQSPKSHTQVTTQRPLWMRWLMPVAACAGMVLTFWVGTQNPLNGQKTTAAIINATPAEQMVYTPESGVKAELISSADAAAMVIVLDGVKAIPDSVDFFETAGAPANPATDSTAEISPNPESKPQP
jgi:hypothetical protein